MGRLIRHLRSRWLALLPLFAVIGPGIVTATVDNDAGGITTYSLCGAQFGTKLLWTLIPTTLALVVAQEMCSRMGVVTRKGLADLIRENFGVRTTFLLLLGLLIANLGTTCAEFAGIAASCELFHIPKYVSVPLAALGVWWLVLRGTYRGVEKVFLLATVFYGAYIVSGLLGHLPWRHLVVETVRPQIEPSYAYVAMFVGVVGTTIAPWMQFYLQAAVVDKGLTAKDYRYSRLDVMLGYALTMTVAFFVIATCSKFLHEHQPPIRIETAKEAALALEPVARGYSKSLFGFGLFVSSLFGATVLPLSTTFCICEGIGWERGVDRNFREAPEFYTLYTAMIVIGALVAVWPHAPLVPIMYWSQVLNGAMLPPLLILMLLLINRPEIMGGWVNSLAFNAVAWLTSIVLILLSVILLIGMAFPWAS